MQTDELRILAGQRGWNIVEVFEEIVSGAKKNEEREALSKMLALIEKGNVHKVLVFNLDRLGRNLQEILRTMDILNQFKVSLFIKAYSLDTLNEDGQPNPIAQFMISLLGSVAALERQQIRTRMSAGYQAYRAKGGSVGRKTGSTTPPDVLLEKHREAVKLLKQGYSVRKVSKLTDRSSTTVQKLKKLIEDPVLK